MTNFVHKETYHKLLVFRVTSDYDSEVESHRINDYYSTKWNPYNPRLTEKGGKERKKTRLFTSISKEDSCIIITNENGGGREIASKLIKKENIILFILWQFCPENPGGHVH